MERNFSDEDSIRKLFEENKKQTLECIKSDWTLSITSGNKYDVELSDGNYLYFHNDKEEEMGLKIKNAIKHFATITKSRQRKMSDILKRITKDEK